MNIPPKGLMYGIFIKVRKEVDIRIVEKEVIRKLMETITEKIILKDHKSKFLIKIRLKRGKLLGTKIRTSGGRLTIKRIEEQMQK